MLEHSPSNFCALYRNVETRRNQCVHTICPMLRAHNRAQCEANYATVLKWRFKVLTGPTSRVAQVGPTSAQQQSNAAQRWSMPGRCLPHGVQFGPTSVEIRPQLVQSGRFRSNCGRVRSIRLQSGRSRPNFRAEFGRLRKCCPPPSWPNVAPDFGRLRPLPATSPNVVPRTSTAIVPER